MMMSRCVDAFSLLNLYDLCDDSMRENHAPLLPLVEEQTAKRRKMFYSEQVLAKKKGALARIWIAAHFERKLSKAQLIQTNIESSVGAF